MEFSNQTFTITFGDVAENHRGMQKIGQNTENGFTLDELQDAQKLFGEKKCKTKLIKLNKYLPNNVKADHAYILIIKNAIVSILKSDLGANELFDEHNELDPDTKAFMYGRVVNKKARYNLCFSDESQDADYENGKGTIISFADVELTKYVRRKLPHYLGTKANKLQAEANYYYNIDTCGIGYHGDSERKIVIGIRLGETMPLCFQWFYQNNPVGTKLTYHLSHGDMYIMSDKAVGYDWKSKNIYTLRHAAGCDKYTNV